MLEYWFSLTRIFRYKVRIVGSVLLRESAAQAKTHLWHILRTYGLSSAVWQCQNNFFLFSVYWFLFSISQLYQ